jgi:hypothetical protein
MGRPPAKSLLNSFSGRYRERKELTSQSLANSRWGPAWWYCTEGGTVISRWLLICSVALEAMRLLLA